jgi:RNA polymerase sigma factor (sigma-70 family)
MIAAAARCVRERPDYDATDAVSEAFVALLSDPPSVEPDWKVFLPGLIVAMNGARRSPTQTASTDVESVEPHPVEDAANTAIRRVTASETRQRILRVMGYMTERQREITRLRLFEGLSVGEIATVMNTSSSNISQIVIRCLTKLQPVLTQFDTFTQHDLNGVRPPRRGAS